MGKVLLELRATLPARPTTRLPEPSPDRRAHDLIVRALAAAHPGDPVLSEEAPDDRARLGMSRTWVVDPLDGTREFHEQGRTDWAVHVALIVDGRAKVGAVALPARGLTLGTWSPPTVPPPTAARRRVVVSRTRPPSVAASIASALDAEVVALGSAGAKAAAVMLGEADVYAHAGGQYEWDSAAPVAVVTAAGLHASRLDGTPLRYNRPRPWRPDLLICRRELAATVIETVGSFRGWRTREG